MRALYRHLIDDFVIGFCQSIKKKDFTVKSESASKSRKGKREYLNNVETRRMMKEHEKYFESKVEIPLIRHGKKQRLETLINEEALLLAKYLRDEKSNWTPRLAYTKAREMMSS
jgi:CRISPR/Cas system-associated endonuclease Cas1